MKNQNKSLSHLSSTEVINVLQNYVTKSNLVKVCVTNNRGGSKEATFNESEVGSVANEAIFKVINKVEKYRAVRAADPTSQVKRQFEDIPLLIKYFDKAFGNLLKDLANKAGAQKRARYSEVLNTLSEVTCDVHGTWDEVNERERRDILNQAIHNIRQVLRHETPANTEMLINIFSLLFIERVTEDSDLAKELNQDINVVIAMKDRVLRLIAMCCKTEMRELMSLKPSENHFWDIGQDEAKAVNKVNMAEKQNNELNVLSTDARCEVSTVTHSKKVNDKVELTISIQILREATGAKKEVAQSVKQFSVVCDSFDLVPDAKKKLQNEVKKAECLAKEICLQRRRMALEIYGENAA